MTEEATGAVTTVFSNIKNNVVSQLAAPATNTDVAVSLMTGTGASFPTAPFYCSVEYEVMWCTNKVGDSLQVQRGVDGTQASAHPINAVIQIRNNAGLFLDAYDAIREIDAGVTTGAALPADIVYRDKVQELTHKTIDLTDSSKQNVIIGNVSADPSTLNYSNILNNGGFEDWPYGTSYTLAAGNPTSGSRNIRFARSWVVQGVNDSSITAARDTANTDPGYPSGVDVLLNLSTIQSSDAVGIKQDFITGDNLSSSDDLLKIVNSPVSVSVRLKLLTGNIQARIRLFYSDGTSHNIIGPYTQVPTSYSTLKFENQLWVPNVNVVSATVLIEFQGTGQVAIDSVMLVLAPVATQYRPSFPAISNSRLAVDVQRANLLVNGGFEVWQRGTSFNANGLTTADRWITQSSNGLAGIGVGRTPSTIGSHGYSLLLGQNPVSGSTFILYQGLIEILPQLLGKTITFSAWVQESHPGAIKLGLVMSGSTSPDAYSGYNSSSAAQRLSVTMTVPLDCTALYAKFIEDSANNVNVEINDATLVIGSVPGDYVPMHPADELARCMRYYERQGDSYGQTIGAGVCAGSPQGGYFVSIYKEKKPVSPTITFTQNGLQIFDAQGGTWRSSTTAGVVFGGPDSATLAFGIGTSALIIGQSVIVCGNSTGQGMILESNP